MGFLHCWRQGEGSRFDVNSSSSCHEPQLLKTGPSRPQDISDLDPVSWINSMQKAQCRAVSTPPRGCLSSTSQILLFQTEAASSNAAGTGWATDAVEWTWMW